MDQVNLSQIRLARVLGHPRAVFDGRAEVSIALDAYLHALRRRDAFHAQPQKTEAEAHATLQAVADTRLAAVHELALRTPITYQVALDSFNAKNGHDLMAGDSNRAGFLAVWALMVREMAEATLDELVEQAG